MKYTLEFKNKENIEETIEKELGIKELGIKVKAVKDDDILNGYINTKEVNGKTIVEVITYDKDEPADYFEGVYKNIPYNHGHKTSFVSVKEDLTKNVSDLANKCQ